MPNKKKLEKAEQLTKILSEKNNFVVVKFEATSHQKLEQLRKTLRKKMAYFTVVKNTIFEKALESLIKVNTALKSVKEKFFPIKQSSALLTFDKDWLEGLSAFYQFAKEERSLSFKFGFLDGVAYESQNLLRLATLPSKPELLGKIVGSLKSPSSRLVYAIKFSQMRLVNIISQLGKKKGGEQNG